MTLEQIFKAARKLNLSTMQILNMVEANLKESDIRFELLKLKSKELDMKAEKEALKRLCTCQLVKTEITRYTLKKTA